MKRKFMERALREKILLLFFAALVAGVWGLRVSRRVGEGWREWRQVATDRDVQERWLSAKSEIEAKAAAAAKSLDHSRTLDATRLVGELNAMATRAGLSAEISSQEAERTSQFAYHIVQVNFRRADMSSLLKFYGELSARSPYIGLERFSLVSDRGNPGQLNASFRTVSVELAP